MKGVALLAAVLVVALAAPVASRAGKIETGSLAPAAAWLEGRIEDLAVADQAVARAEVQGVLDELRERLGDAGLDEPVVEGIVGARTRPAGDGEGAPLDPLETAHARLSRFARGASRPQPARHPGARETLEEILDDPVFRDASDAASFLRRAQYAVQRFLGRALGGLLRFVGSNATIASIIVVSFVLASLAFVVSRWLGAAPRGRRAASPADAVRGEPVLRSDAKALLDRAARETDAGRWDRAVRLAEQAAVVALVGREALPSHPGMTDLEGLRSLHARGEAAREAFGALVDLHDSIVFGGLEPDATAAARATDLAASLVGPQREEAA